MRLFTFGVLAICVAISAVEGPYHALAADGSKTAAKQSLSTDFGFKESAEDKNQPLFVKSKSVQLNAKDRVFTYRGNVEITKGELLITCETMVGDYDENNQLQTMTCQENVVITRGEGLRASSNRAVYFVPKGVIELTEGPELFRDGSLLSADKVTIFVNEDRSEAEGNVQVKVVQAQQKQQAKTK